MNHVQRGDVIVLLAQNEEKRVGELDELGDVVPPAAVGHANGLRTVRIVHRLAR